MTDTAVPTFSMAERDRRWNLARAFMRREGLDALLVFGEHEDSGSASFKYDTWFTNGRAGSSVIFPRTGEPVQLLPAPMLVMDHLESSRRGDNIWIPPQNLRGSRDSGAITQTLNELRLAKGAIGVAGLEPALPWYPEGIMPYGLWNVIVTQFPDATFRPAGLALGQLMLRLSGEEIAAVRQSAGIGEARRWSGPWWKPPRPVSQKARCTRPAWPRDMQAEPSRQPCTCARART